MDTRLLRYFIAVAEEGHFRRAAVRLHMSQPPLSYAIKQLEQQLGARLLDRTSRRVALTEAGRAFLREARALVRRADEVRTLVRRIDAGLRGQLRVGFVGSMLYRGLPGFLRQLREQLPDVESVLIEQNSEQQIESVRRGEIDLGFIHANPLPDGFGALSLVSEPFVVCLPQQHPLAASRRFALQALSHEELILFSREASPLYYETVLAMCAQAGFVPAVRHEVRHWLTVVSLIAQGLGVSIVPASLAQSRLAGACFRPFAHAAESVSQMIWDAGRTPPATIQAVALAERFWSVASFAARTNDANESNTRAKGSISPRSHRAT